MTSLIVYSSEYIGKFLLHFLYSKLKLNKGIYNGYDKIKNREYLYRGKKTYSHLISPDNGEYVYKHNKTDITAEL